MAIVGIQIDKTNPVFTSADFLVWMPQFRAYIQTDEGTATFAAIYEIANNKIFKSIFGTDWKLAMSYCIAHYLALIGMNSQQEGGQTLASIPGNVIHGVLSSASVGDFSKSYDISKSVVDEQEAMFWNQTAYGASLMALYKTKAVPSIFVVTSGNAPRGD